SGRTRGHRSHHVCRRGGRGFRGRSARGTAGSARGGASGPKSLLVPSASQSLVAIGSTGSPEERCRGDRMPGGRQQPDGVDDPAPPPPVWKVTGIDRLLLPTWREVVA